MLDVCLQLSQLTVNYKLYVLKRPSICHHQRVLITLNLASAHCRRREDAVRSSVACCAAMILGGEQLAVGLVYSNKGMRS